MEVQTPYLDFVKALADNGFVCSHTSHWIKGQELWHRKLSTMQTITLTMDYEPFADVRPEVFKVWLRILDSTPPHRCVLALNVSVADLHLLIYDWMNDKQLLLKGPRA